MPIKVACQCGQRFSARDDLMGKTVRCPSCGGNLTIRSPVPVATPIARAPTPPAVPQTSPPPSDFPWEDAPIPKTTMPAKKKPVSHVKPAFPETIPPVPEADFPWDDGAGTEAAQPVSVSKTPARPTKHAAGFDLRGWIVTETGLSISMGSLIVGGGAFAIIAIAALAISSPDALPQLISSGGSGTFAILLIWSVIAWMASYVSMGTGWWVCWAVPKETNSRPWIQAALGGIGATLAIILLLQLLALAMAPSPPSFNSGRQPRNFAEAQKAQAEMQRAMQQMQENAKIIGFVMKTGSWLSMLASIAAFTAFGLFLGILGKFLGRDQSQQLAIFFCILEGVFALWMTVLVFAVEPESPTMIRLIVAVTMALMLATYGGLIYLCYDVRQLVVKHARA